MSATADPLVSTGPRPPIRPWHSVTALDRFAIVTWTVEPDRMAMLLPDGFEPEEFDHDGGKVALASMVAFLDRDFRFRGMPWPRLSCGQINYRLYVRRGDDTGVWFVGTTLDSPLVAIPRWLWSMPWHRDRVRLDGVWDGERCRGLTLDASGDWGDARLDLAPFDAGPPDALDAPATTLPGGVRSARLTDPVLGWYARHDGRVGRYSVWHPPLPLQPMRVAAARTAVFERLDLIDVGAPAVDALVSRSVLFDVHTPPRVVRGTTPIRRGA